MYKRIIVFCFLLMAIIISSFFYNYKTQKLIIKLLDLKVLINDKATLYLSKTTNDNTLKIDVANIIFLEPNWQNIIRIKIEDIDISSSKQKQYSKIKNIELGFANHSLLNSLISNKNKIVFNYFKIKDITLNAIIDKNNFYPGPLMAVLFAINKEYQKQNIQSKVFQNFLEKDIFLGKVKLFFLDKRDSLKDSIIDISCNDVNISEQKTSYRTLSLECEKKFDYKFSINGKFSHLENSFEGALNNIKPELFFGTSINFNSNNEKILFSSRLNGDFKIKTNKNFKIKSFEFNSKESKLNIQNIQNYNIFNGKILWNKKSNELKFLNCFFDNLFSFKGNINLQNKRGFFKINAEKIDIESIHYLLDINQNRLNSLLYIDRDNVDFAFKKYMNQLKDGAFKKVNLSLNFLLTDRFKKIHITNIIGNSNFSDIRVNNSNNYFKNFLATISGNLKFSFSPNKKYNVNKENWIRLALKANYGSVVVKKSLPKYTFDNANINLEITQKSFEIFKADFYKNSNLDFSFKNIKINQKSLIEGYLSVNLNKALSVILEKETKIKLLGSPKLFFKINGNIKNLNFKLYFDSDLTNTSINIPFINLVKKKNTIGRMKSNIFIENGKIKLFKKNILIIKNDIFTIESILINNNSINQIHFKNILIPGIKLNDIYLYKTINTIKFEASGKSIDLTNFRKKIQNESDLLKDVLLDFDITAEEIIVDTSIKISGNLKGIRKGNSVNAIALGKMSLGKASILHSGKLNISLNSQISSIEGFGLIGGAETKVVIKKKKNMLPEIYFDTIDGGKLLSALNFTNKVKSGKMTIKISFLDNSYEHYNGIIKANFFNLIDTPGIINSLSVLSFSGIKSIISGEGVSFNDGEVKIYVKDKVFSFDPLFLSSQSLGIVARGKLDLSNNIIDMRGSVVPIKAISKILSVVPGIGELMTGLKKEGLIAGQFKMLGHLSNPKVTINTMSFAPGILRDIFSKDWLDKKYFFLKNRTN